MTFTFACLLGLALATASVSFQAFRRAWRQRRLKGLELRPNCLLTRYPIVFLSGRRSLFRPFEYWNDVPLYLREHGYEVIVVEPVRKEKTIESILLALDSLGEKCHLIADSSLEEELREIARSKRRSIQTLTQIRNSARTTDSDGENTKRSPTIIDLKPLESAVEVFELSPVLSAAALRTTERPLLWMNLVSLFLLRLHNAISNRGPGNWFGQRRVPVDAIETGEVVLLSGWPIEAKILDLAISLAERDAQWSD